MESRKQDFKRTVGAAEGRRRRTETTLQIRKEKKALQLRKKRTNTSSEVVDAIPMMDSSMLQSGEASHRPTMADSPRYKEMLISSNASEQNLVEATRGFRRILSVEKNIPAREVIEMGIVPYLIENLSVTPGSSTALIFESAWALTNIAATEFTQYVVDAGCIKPLVQLITHGDSNVCEQAVWCLGNIAGEGPMLRDCVLQESPFQSLFLILFNAERMSLVENIVWTISNLCRGSPPPPNEITQPVIFPLVSFLERSYSNEAKIDALWALSYLSDGDNERIEKVLSSGVATKLIQLLENKEMKSKSKTPIVRILGNFVSGNDSQTQAVLDAGILIHLAGLMGSPSKSIRKESSWLASNIACGNHAQITTLLQEPRVLTKIIKNAKYDTWEVRKEALWALANICTTGTHSHTIIMVNAGGLEPLITVLKLTHIETDLLIAVLDALRKILEAGECVDSGNYQHIVEEHNGIDYLEELQTHPSEIVYEKVVNLIEDYFGVQDDGDENLAPATNDQGTYNFGLAPGIASPKQLFKNFGATENIPFENRSTNTRLFF